MSRISPRARAYAGLNICNQMLESFGKTVFSPQSQSGRNLEWKLMKVQSGRYDSICPGPNPTPTKDWRSGQMEKHPHSESSEVSTLNFFHSDSDARRPFSETLYFHASVARL